MTHGKSRRTGWWGAVCLVALCLAGLPALFFFSSCNGTAGSGDLSGVVYGYKTSSTSSGQDNTAGGTASTPGTYTTDITLSFYFPDGSRFRAGTGPAGGTTTVTLDAADIGLPDEGSVVMTITGEGLEDWSGEAEADADGKVYFHISPIASGTEVIVSLEVKDRDGNVVSSGSKPQTVEGDGSEICVSLSGGDDAEEAGQIFP